MQIHNNRIIPLACLVMVVGPPFSGKTTICNTQFPEHEILSLEKINQDLFGHTYYLDNTVLKQELHNRTIKKLSLGERVVVDAVLDSTSRMSLVTAAQDLGVKVLYLVVGECPYTKADVENPLFQHRKKYINYFNNLKMYLNGDGLAEVMDCRGQSFNIVRQMPYLNLFHTVETTFAGITAIGDIHSSLEQLVQGVQWALSRNHLVVFLGDIIDYGKFPVECVGVVYEVLVRGKGIMVRGNHEKKIYRWLDQYQRGNVTVQLSHGNQQTVDAVLALPENEFKAFVTKFHTVYHLARDHYVIGNTVFSHGGGHANLFEIYSPKLYGELATVTTYGETQKSNNTTMPTRTYDWIDTIPSGKMVIMGHDIQSMDKPVTKEGKLGGVVLFMDCGCGKGGPSFGVDLKMCDGKLVITNYVKN